MDLATVRTRLFNRKPFVAVAGARGQFSRGFDSQTAASEWAAARAADNKVRQAAVYRADLSSVARRYPVEQVGEKLEVFGRLDDNSVAHVDFTTGKINGETAGLVVINGDNGEIVAAGNNRTELADVAARCVADGAGSASVQRLLPHGPYIMLPDVTHHLLVDALQVLRDGNDRSVLVDVDNATINGSKDAVLLQVHGSDGRTYIGVAADAKAASAQSLALIKSGQARSINFLLWFTQKNTTPHHRSLLSHGGPAHGYDDATNARRATLPSQGKDLG